MAFVLAIDIGGTSTKIGVVRTTAPVAIVAQGAIQSEPTHSPNDLVARIAQTAELLIRQLGEPIVGVGVGCPGLISQQSGTILKSPNLPGLVGFPLRDTLQKLLGCVVELQNDASAAVLGEYLFGQGRGVQNLILLTLGTGVGGGVITSGKLLEGADNAAGELGHLKVEYGGEICGCGRRGCLEAYVGAAGIRRIAQQIAKESREPDLIDSEWSTKDLAAAARAGNTTARRAFEVAGRYLGRGIALLIDTFNPETVLLGGGASGAYEFLEQSLLAEVETTASFSETRSRTVIAASTLADATNLLGAAAACLHGRWTAAASTAVPSSPPTSIYEVASESGYVLGMHIGASSIHVGVLSTTGQVISKLERYDLSGKRRSRPYRDLILEAVEAAAEVTQTAAANGVALNQVVGTGVVVPVPVAVETGRVARAPAIRKLEDVCLGDDLRQELKTRLGLDCPIIVENDANGAALAELYFGDGKGLPSFLTILLCTGIGGSLILNGRLYRGHNNSACEVGHITIHPDGPTCGCGSRGCLETRASGSALEIAARERGLFLPGSSDHHYLGLIRAAAADEKVQKLFIEFGEYFGIGLASLVNVLNPARVFLSGKLCAAHDYFWPVARPAFKARLYPGIQADVVKAATHDQSELKGALASFLYARGSQP